MHCFPGKHVTRPFSQRSTKVDEHNQILYLKTPPSCFYRQVAGSSPGAAGASPKTRLLELMAVRGNDFHQSQEEKGTPD